MAQVPYPPSEDTLESIKKWVTELIRTIYEERTGGLFIGDVFEDAGDILTLSLASDSGLEKVSNALQIDLNSTGGLEISSGVKVKCKTSGGLASDVNGLYVSATAYGFGGVHPSTGQDIAADALADTINVAGGTGITVTGVAATDTLTIEVKQQAAIVDASISHSITDPGTPTGCNGLRDDLVNNTIPAIETALNNLGTKINAIISALESAEILHT